MNCGFPLVVVCGYLCLTAIAFAEKPKHPVASEAQIRRALERLIIPRVEFCETPVPEAIHFLRQAADRLAPNGRRIPFFVRIEPSPPAAAEVVPKSTTAGAPPATAEPKITIGLSNIPLIEALRYVTELASLKFRIQPDGVHIVPADDPDPMFTRDFRIPADLLSALEKSDRAAKTDVVARIKKDVRAFLMEEGITFPEGAAAILNDEGTRLTVRTTADRFEGIQVFLDWLAQAVKPPPVPGPEVPKVTGHTDSTLVENMRRKMQRIILAKVAFARVPLGDAVATLREQGYRADTRSPKASRGVNLVFRPAENSEASVVGAAAGPPITYCATKVSLGEALESVTRLAAYHLDVQPYAVTISQTPLPDTLLTREFLVPPNFLPNARPGPDLGDADPAARRERAQEFLLSSGVPFPSGPSATFIPSVNRDRLVVRDTEARLADVQQKVEAAWREYYAAEKAKKKRRGR